MITRPLDLASKMRPPPRDFDVLFLVNGGLIALFFFVFGSRFVLAPGLGLEFRLPEIPGAQLGLMEHTHHISVRESGVIIADEGSITLKRLGEWLEEQAKTTPRPVLLVTASAALPAAELVRIYTVADAAKFRVVLSADRQPVKGAANP